MRIILVRSEEGGDKWGFFCELIYRKVIVIPMINFEKEIV